MLEARLVVVGWPFAVNLYGQIKNQEWTLTFEHCQPDCHVIVLTEFIFRRFGQAFVFSFLFQFSNQIW